MAFLSSEQLENMGFQSLGKGVLISDKASIYNPEQMTLGDHSRIDDFCVVSGRVNIGRNVHIAVFCNVAGGSEGVILHDFSGLAYGCQLFSQSDDYSGRTMTNPTVPSEYKREKKLRIEIGKHCILGACSVVFPGVNIADGTATGAMTVVNKSTESWSIYTGNPAQKVKDRKKDLLKLEQAYLSTEIGD